MKISQFEPGKVSVIMVTYNRGVLIKRSIESLLNQTYRNIEIIIVDNGSTDNTSSVLKEYDTPAFRKIIRLFKLEENRNFTGGGNFALEQVKGEWFTFLDDDDMAFPHAIETMIRIPEKINSKINAITCNCINSSTGQFGGKGLQNDQYLPLRKIVRVCRGEFWGITKTELLQDARFNEDLIGYEDTFWHQINQRADRYYIHQALRIWYTNYGPETITQSMQKKDRLLRAKIYRPLVDEDLYWTVLRKHAPWRYRRDCLKGLLFLHMNNDIKGARKYLRKLANYCAASTLIARASIFLPSGFFRIIFHLLPYKNGWKF